MVIDTPAWMVAAFAFAVTAVAVLPLKRIAWALDFVDRPAARKHHRAPTPMLGGLALVAGVLIAPLLTAVEPARYAAIVGASVLLLVVGLFDDRFGVGVGSKLLAQGIAAALVLAAGWTGPWCDELGAILGTMVSVAWLVAVTNAFNLLDNVDGLAASIAATAAIGMLALDASAFGRTLAASLVGATLGFLLHNWAPARIFMGDAGSLPLGLIVATLGLEVGHASSAGFAAWLVPMLVLAVPILDTATVCVSRLRRGRNPLTTPGTDHLSHRLLRRGWGVPGAVGVLVLAGLTANALAVAFAMPAAGLP